jgi:DNA/RNA-binding domain of Phe-tRNA-synthetase-like protein
MISIFIDNAIKAACPQLTLGLISCKVHNTSMNESLWDAFLAAQQSLRSRYSLEQIKQMAAIEATRNVYKRLGKDPNRYRPSAEALCRRIIRHLPIYQINTLVDLINLVSIQTGFSIGGFDADKIKGDLLLTVGTAEDSFEGIGRGLLNIEGLPVYKDAMGGIGTPTSDHERTKITLDTSHLLMIINGYSGNEGIQEALTLTVHLLHQYALAEEIVINTITNAPI